MTELVQDLAEELTQEFAQRSLARTHPAQWSPAGAESAQPPAAPAEACVRCGHDADFDIASMWLCVDCYHIAGSTCSGIGPRPAANPTVQSRDQVC